MFNDLASWTHLILICLCYALGLCLSFRSCALPPSLLFHALFLSPIQTHKAASTIFWRDNQKLAGLGKYSIISNLLILPNWRRQWHPTPVVLLGKSHGWRSLVGCSPNRIKTGFEDTVNDFTSRKGGNKGFSWTFYSK